MLNQHEETIGKNLVFDGRMLFTGKKTDDVQLQSTHNGITYTVSIINTRTLSPDDPNAPLQFYDLLFKKILRTLKLKPIGRQYFDPSRAIQVQGHPVTLWPGYVTSIRQTQGGVSLIADVSHKVLRTDTVHELIMRKSKIKKLKKKKKKKK